MPSVTKLPLPCPARSYMVFLKKPSQPRDNVLYPLQSQILVSAQLQHIWRLSLQLHSHIVICHFTWAFLCSILLNEMPFAFGKGFGQIDITWSTFELRRSSHRHHGWPSNRWTSLHKRLVDNSAVVFVQRFTPTSGTFGCVCAVRSRWWRRSTTWHQKGFHKAEARLANAIHTVLFYFYIVVVWILQYLHEKVTMTLPTVQECSTLPRASGVWPWANCWEGLVWPKKVSNLFQVSMLGCLNVQDLILPVLPAICELFSLPSSISAFQNAEAISFDAMQLSTQGAERQRKDVSCQDLFGPRNFVLFTVLASYQTWCWFKTNLTPYQGDENGHAFWSTPAWEESLWVSQWQVRPWSDPGGNCALQRSSGEFRHQTVATERGRYHGHHWSGLWYVGGMPADCERPLKSQ